MQTPSPSRSHTITHIFAITCLVLVAAFAVRAYVPLPWFQHPVYTRSLFFSSGRPDHFWHPGERITLTWKADPAGTTQDWQPIPVTITGKLFGPYADADDAALSIEQKGLDQPQHLLAAAATLQTDTWASDTRTMVVTLPSTLHPGPYFFDSSILGKDHQELPYLPYPSHPQDESIGFSITIVAP